MTHTVDESKLEQFMGLMVGYMAGEPTSAIVPPAASLSATPSSARCQ